MRPFVLLILISLPLAAADEARLALGVRAQTDFARVDQAGTAHLEDAGQCVQSQAAALAVALPGEAAQLHYQKGFCLLAGAAITRRSSEYADAATEFDKAIESWPARLAARPKKLAPEPVSPGLHVLAVLARLEADSGPTVLDHARQDLNAFVSGDPCSSEMMPAVLCQQLLQKGRDWLGWMALQRDDLWEASRDFSGAGAPRSAFVQAPQGWVDWVAGKQAFAERRYQTAAERYQAAATSWDSAARQSPPNILLSLDPRPDLAGALADLGGAQLLAGDPAAAIRTLDRAVHEDSSRAKPLYLRALAKEAAGDPAAAMSDYNLASRTAFAAAKDSSSGEAHLYRGIMLYRRKDWARAEDEFSSALNFEIPASLRADAQAWRHLAAVAAGSCEASRDYLERSLETVSPYFPKDVARDLAAACSATAAARRSHAD